MLVTLRARKGTWSAGGKGGKAGQTHIHTHTHADTHTCTHHTSLYTNFFFSCNAVRGLKTKAYYYLAHTLATRQMPLTLITLSVNARGCTMHAQCWYNTVVLVISPFCTWLHGVECQMLPSGARGCTVLGVIACKVLHVVAQCVPSCKACDLCLGGFDWIKVRTSGTFA